MMIIISINLINLPSDLDTNHLKEK